MSREGPAIRATPADQARLLELQAIDTTIDQLRHRRQNLPEQSELKAAAAAHAVEAESLVAAETAVSDLQLSLTKAENDLVPVRERRERNQRRIADGSIGDPKALATMVDEVEHLGRRIGELEDAELELMEQLEQANAERDAAAARKAGLLDRAREVKARRDAAVAEIDADLASRDSDRAAAVVALPAPLVATYEKARASHNGVGAAALVHRRCTGCSIDVNAADLRAYAAAAEDELLHCEECGRILIRTADSGL